MTEIEDIRQGVLRFRKKIFPIRRAIYEQLANHQDPQVLFITCIDSRVDPSDLCDSDPGDMFVERTPGNLVPIYSEQRVGVAARVGAVAGRAGLPLSPGVVRLRRGGVRERGDDDRRPDDDATDAAEMMCAHARIVTSGRMNGPEVLLNSSSGLAFRLSRPVEAWPGGTGAARSPFVPGGVRLGAASTDCATVHARAAPHRRVPRR